MQPRISSENRIDPRCTCQCHEPDNDILCCGAGSGCCGGAGTLRYDSVIAIFGDEDGFLKKAMTTRKV